MTHHYFSSFLTPLLIGTLLCGSCPLPAQQKQFTYDQVYKYSGPEVLTSLPVIDGWLDAEH
jgi:hypothetical protein